jgi:hypothetical protein
MLNASQLKMAYEETRAAKARLAEQRRKVAEENGSTVAGGRGEPTQPVSGRERERG